MGRGKRLRPARLGEKLFAIRRHFGWTLEQMADKLSNEKFTVRRQAVSQFELDDNEPSLLVLLRYAKLANTVIDVFADDSRDLPPPFC
jgi:transcriptional regulator with XRE-family HTH domain